MIVKDFQADYAESIRTQRMMVADLKFYADHKHLGTRAIVMQDPKTGEKLSMGAVFDRHALMLTLASELEHKFAKGTDA